MSRAPPELRAMRQEFRVEGLNEPVSHYTDAVRWGDLLFISGLAPLDQKSRLVGGDDVAKQTRQIFENMAKILAAGDAGFEDVLRVTVYLTDIADRAKINPVRQEFFGTTRPPSTLSGVSALVVPGVKVQIEASVGPKRARSGHPVRL